MDVVASETDNGRNPVGRLLIIDSIDNLSIFQFYCIRLYVVLCLVYISPSVV